MAMTISDAVVCTLMDWGVGTVFALPGDGVNGFMEALRKAQDSIRYAHLQHEEAAAMAACAYANFTGRLGVCFSTAAPGAIHMLKAGALSSALRPCPMSGTTLDIYQQFVPESQKRAVEKLSLLTQLVQ